MYTKIIGTGSYLPEQVRTNADLEKMVETSDEWIVTRTGIRERRIAAAHETVATMGFEAAKQALAMAGVSAEQIGLIIVATTSGTHAFPSSACQIQSMLGVKGCPAFDVAAACAGFTYALSVADQYVKNGAVDYALVMAPMCWRAPAIRPIAERLLFSAMAPARWCWAPPKSRALSRRICMLTAAMANC
jgi:3-oxoacyl-[acyl-carrier-protein] synthase-3